MERESAEMVRLKSAPRRGDEMGALWAIEEQMDTNGLLLRQGFAAQAATATRWNPVSRVV